MEKILKSALLINLPVLFVALPTTFSFVLATVFDVLIKRPYDKRALEEFMTFTPPIFLTFALSFLVLTIVFYLASKKIAIIKYLKYIAAIPLILAIFSTINEIIIPIYTQVTKTDGQISLLWIFNIVIVSVLVAYTIVYLIYSLQKVSELYNQ